MKLKGGLYHQTQIRMAYNSNHMEGSRLTEDQTRSIYETRTIGVNDGYEKIDDIIETVNHFRCFDYILSIADKELSEDIKLHLYNQFTIYFSAVSEGDFKPAIYCDLQFLFMRTMCWSDIMFLEQDYLLIMLIMLKTEKNIYMIF